MAIDVSDGVVAGDKTNAAMSTRSESRDAIFVVHGAANYNATMQIKAYQEKNGMTIDEVQSDPRCCLTLPLPLPLPCPCPCLCPRPCPCP